MADPLAPGTSFAGYAIEEIAGRGGMGVVYRARQLRPSRRVALKVIAPEFAQDADFRRRFERESETAAAIEHPNVIPVYEVGDADGVLFIAMRFVEGTDLRALFDERGALDPGLAAGLVAQVAGALDAAHKRGLVHRDVKPANVLIAGGEGAWHPYLTDFGLSKNVSSESGVTGTGMFVGTLDYIAPEQLLGGPLDARADVYALGCVLFEALTGQVPYPRDTAIAVMYAHGNEPPPSALAVRPDLPPEFDDVIKRAMAKDPDDRYASAGDLGRAARAAAQSKRQSEARGSVATGAAAPPAARSVQQPAGAAPRPRRRALIAGGVALVVALLAVLAIALSGGGSSSQRLSKTEYDTKAANIARGVDQTPADRRLNAPLPADAAKRAMVSSDLAGVQSSLSDAANRLDALRPPKDAAAAHSHAKAVIGSLVKSLEAARTASDAGDAAAFKAAADSYRVALHEAQNVTAEFKSLGYQQLGG